MTEDIRARLTKSPIAERLTELIVPAEEPTESPVVREFYRGFNQCRREVLANLERLCETAKVVYSGERFGGYHDTDFAIRNGTHTSILLDIQPLSRKVKVSEIIDGLKKFPAALRDHDLAKELSDLADRIQKEGVEHE